MKTASLRSSIRLPTTATYDPAKSEVELLKARITECEVDLQKHRAAFTEAERLARFGTWSFDVLAKQPDFSEEARRLLGFDDVHHMSAAVDQLAHLYNEDRIRISERLRASLKEGKDFDMHIRVVRKDGGLRWLRVIGRPEKSGIYQPRHVSGILVDITAHKRDRMKQQVELAVTRLLMGTDPLPYVIGKIIRVVCQTLGWEWGAYWALNEATDQMNLIKGLSVDRKTYNAFEHASRKASFSSGLGLIGEVFQTGESRWINDVTSDTTFLRRDEAIAVGLRGGFAFPVRVDGRVVGVLEFFSRFARQPDASLPALSRALSTQIGQFIQRQLSDERIRHLASYDDLTGLLNRQQFNEQVRQTLDQAQRKRQRIGVMFIDLDRFKVINDTLGHDAGDAVLQEFAARLRTALGGANVVARLGGDEFAVLVPQCDDVDVLNQMATKILRNTIAPVRLVGSDYRISASIGVSIFPDDGVSAPVLLRGADIAMYRAKSRGGNSMQFHSAAMDTASPERLTLEASLAQALVRDELSLNFQPIYHLKSQCVIGFEALMRWHHPNFGDVSPGQFISLAEETGLIRTLGQFALRRACEEAMRWPALLTIAVNVSTRQLIESDFLEQVTSTLRDTGLAPERLRLEITESALMRQAAVPLLEQIRKLGVRLSIDDFGTGYSSLMYLKRLPLDSIKLDRSFVRGLPHDPNDSAIACAVIALGKSLKLSVVAEGVERVEQRDFLDAAGCDAIQGYLLSRPMPGAQVASWLDTHNVPGDL
ncbi:hypothetical protein LMG26411_08033 [Cupriavidus numazuensis]|uniref:EAL domain-containing protein n=2 Tax=Cupriavidus numazuensis TaxID=221992 RepID=A0ABN7QG41_9BURK|nr:hypothetical protein LMG26411_08033 [Cupriavidus numazuensis]